MFERFTDRARRAVVRTQQEARQLHHNYIGTEHILLGLIREGDGVAAQIMRKHGDLSVIRAAVFVEVPAWTGSDGPRGIVTRLRRRRGGGDPSGGLAAFDVELEPTATLAVDATLAEAARLAGAQPVGSHHLLLAALADSSSAAAKALASAGIDLDQAKDALRGVDITGTSDEQPEEAGRRQM